ncbi:hypothetical protein MBAV_001659 [Candidatus Magnetobacterium bavaricum]|uniref:Uncharacterized protein n=1 Tax=Candidatus Magnetobacterium bavaricum TaxID=29290 RepID=A0A0F3GZL3_9BACT|nr:hypothetical protein MBAV_001659 [Candidatus Magnetobacterium bavaricum]
MRGKPATKNLDAIHEPDVDVAVGSVLPEDVGLAVAYNIRYTNANCKDKGKYRVYLNKALKENWGAGLAEDVEAAKKQATFKKTEAKKKDAEVTHDKETYDRAVEYIGKLKAKERKKLEAEALKTLPSEQQEKVKAGNFFALKGLQFSMQGIVMERLAGQEREML